MKRLIVSGATSMIGLATIEAAVSHGCEVYAIAREGSRRINCLPESGLVKVVFGSLDTFGQIKGLPRVADVFYHFAWAGTGKMERNDPFIQEKNIKYTLDAVELARKTGCVKFIGAGSQAEYGSTDGEITDGTRFRPDTAYGAAKNAAFLLSRKLCEQYDMIHIWGRIFSVYGVRDRDGTVLNYAIDNFLKKAVASFSEGTQNWNFLNERDAGEIFYLLGEKVDQTKEYRVASDVSKPLRAYIEELAEMMDAAGFCSFAVEGGGERPYGIKTCDEILFSDISFRPSVSFRDGIREVIEERKRKREHERRQRFDSVL